MWQIWVNSTRLDPYPNWPEPILNSLKMTRFDPFWPAIRLTRPACFAMSSCCPHCVAHFIFFPMLSSPSLTKFNHSQSHCTCIFQKMITVLTAVYFRQTTCPNSPSQHLGHHQTLYCDDVPHNLVQLVRSWWGVPSVLMYNFLFNHLFDGILRNWPFGLAKILDKYHQTSD